MSGCEILISIRDLSYAYQEGILALADIDADIYLGEFLAIIGPNGSGKSTLARHLNALLLPTRGFVMVGGLNTADADNLWIIRQQVGMVFQNPDNQLVASTVEEDIAFGPENLGLPAEEISQRVEEAMSLVGLTGQRLRPPHSLSGGQKQRLAIAGVLALRPKCLVLDEPVAMLDPAGRQEVMRTMVILNKQEGLTVVLITHDMEDVIQADRVWLLSGGRLVLSGTPAEVFARREILSEVGLELPEAAELAWRLSVAGWPVPPGILTLEGLVSVIDDMLANQRLAPSH